MPLWCGLAVAAAALAVPSLATAQSWEGGDTRPSLREIVSVDATGESGWPYGREDLAGDGTDTFGPLEAAVDVRTVYAQTDSERAWLRAYTSDTGGVPAPTTTLFVFVDLDRSSGSGGGANASVIDPALVDDPTSGGFELALVAQADGSRAELWRWDSNDNRWNEITLQVDEMHVESGTDRDPISVGADTGHGYIQLDVLHSLSRLVPTCDSRFFVRTFDAEIGYGDLDAGGLRACRAPDTDNDGAPDIVEETTSGCQVDADCPGDGICLSNGACVIGVECVDDGDCASGYACSGNQVCVRVITAQCSDDGDCDGQVCDAGACQPCALSGARSCGGDLVCAPNGECVDPDTVTPPDPDPDGGEDPFGIPGVEVQGGACTCRQSLGAGTQPAWPLFFVLAGLALAGFALLRHASRPPEARVARHSTTPENR